MNPHPVQKIQLFKQLREMKNDSEPHKHVRETSKVVILCDPPFEICWKDMYKERL